MNRQSARRASAVVERLGRHAGEGGSEEREAGEHGEELEVQWGRQASLGSVLQRAVHLYPAGEPAQHHSTPPARPGTECDLSDVGLQLSCPRSETRAAH
jgi:hypothetical protein